MNLQWFNKFEQVFLHFLFNLIVKNLRSVTGSSLFARNWIFFLLKKSWSAVEIGVHVFFWKRKLRRSSSIKISLISRTQYNTFLHTMYHLHNVIFCLRSLKHEYAGISLIILRVSISHLSLANRFQPSNICQLKPTKQRNLLLPLNKLLVPSYSSIQTKLPAICCQHNSSVAYHKARTNHTQDSKIKSHPKKVQLHPAAGSVKLTVN